MAQATQVKDKIGQVWQVRQLEGRKVVWKPDTGYGYWGDDLIPLQPRDGKGRFKSWRNK